MFDLGRTLLASVERSPQALAVVEGELRLSYAEWQRRIEAIAGGLRDLGLRRGDHLVTLLQNRWENASLHWACQLLGLVITPLNWRASGEELDYVLGDADARALAYEPVTARAVIAATRSAGLSRIAVGDVADDPMVHRFVALLDAAPWRDGPAADADDTSVMLYTSGTTGRPKG
ncbi:MAG: AMP-binding protein, partial [Casimicrobiaceae bacterium]